MKCPICSNEEFSQSEILKERLVQEWNLGPEEVKYINKQQGYYCNKCFSNLRSMTLADAIMKSYRYHENFQNFCVSKQAQRLKILEINEAGGLNTWTRNCKMHTFVKYPDVDIQELPYLDNTFDLIIHSDTLEHIENSIKALKECFRVLKFGGNLIYTIPIVYNRLTLKRHNLPNSYHGNQEETQGEDFKVYTEYGADFWVELLNCGYKKITLSTLEDHTSVAICANKEKIEGKSFFSSLVNFF